MSAMERQEFCDRVLAKVCHATPEEKASIRAELDAHMEDHAAALLEAGYGEAEAAERAMAAMGDPEEIGAELNRDYPLGWLVLSRVSLIVTVMLCATLLFSWPILGNVLYSFQTHIAPESSPFAPRDQYGYERKVDIRTEVGDDILRIYKVGLDVSTDGETGVVGLFTCNYNKKFFGYTANSLDLRFETSATAEDAPFFGSGGGGGGGGGVNYMLVKEIPVTRADDAVTVIYDRYGDYAQIEAPVPWEDAA